MEMRGNVRRVEPHRKAQTPQSVAKAHSKSAVVMDSQNQSPNVGKKVKDTKPDQASL